MGRSHFHSQSGRIDVTTMLFRDRRVAVRTYLPADYEWSGREYPVLYMFDGHNLFDVRTSTYNQEWGIDETMESLHQRGLQPAVVVGVDAPFDKFERYAMYSIGEWPYRKRPEGRTIRRIRGYGDQTAQFVLEQVKPATEQRYRVMRAREGVGVGGSSMGGYMALYCATAYPQLVSRVMAMSPAVLDHPMRGDRLRELVAQAGAPYRMRFWLDAGDAEQLAYNEGRQEWIEAMWLMRDSLLEAGHTEVSAKVYAGAEHNERAWAARFEEAYRWLFAESV